MNLHRRIDAQDQVLYQIRDLLTRHVAEEAMQKKLDAPAAKALEEIVLLWRASRIFIPILVAIVIAGVSFSKWWGEHVK
jgi:hypothetical protein